MNVFLVKGEGELQYEGSVYQNDDYLEVEYLNGANMVVVVEAK